LPYRERAIAHGPGVQGHASSLLQSIEDAPIARRAGARAAAR
jgi:hypothetical protein